MTGIYSEFWIFEVKNLLIEKGSILAECDKIPKMGKIICFSVNTHVLKSEPPLLYSDYWRIIDFEDFVGLLWFTWFTRFIF